MRTRRVTPRPALRFGPAGPAHASAVGAHREAAAQYARARLARDLPLDERAALLERYSHERYLTDEADEAIDSLRAAAECYRALGDASAEGATLTRVSELMWCPGRSREARKVGLRRSSSSSASHPGWSSRMRTTTSRSSLRWSGRRACPRLVPPSSRSGKEARRSRNDGLCLWQAFADGRRERRSGSQEQFERRIDLALLSGP